MGWDEILVFTCSSAPAILSFLRILSFKAVSFMGFEFVSFFFKLCEHQLIDIAPPQA